jgi:hypothetical protein
VLALLLVCIKLQKGIDFILLILNYPFLILNCLAGKEITEEVDIQRLMLYAGADHVLRKV